MTKEEIMNTYSKEQGYESWRELFLEHYFTSDVDGFLEHQNAVTNLIQYELKKKVCDTLTLVHDMPYIEMKDTILNTENL